MRALSAYFLQIRKFIGKRVYYLMALMLIAGFVESIGITLFFPIFQNGFGDDNLSKVLQFIFGLFNVEFSMKVILICIATFFSARAFFLLIYTRYFGKVSANLLVSLRRRMLAKVFSAEYLFLLKKELGAINNVVVREIAFVVQAFEKFAFIINYVLYGIMYVCVSMLLDIKTTIIVLVITPIIYIPARRINALTNRYSVDITASYGRMHSILIQALSKLKYIKATLANTRIAKIIDGENRRMGTLQFKQAYLQERARIIFETAILFMVLAILFVHVAVRDRGAGEVLFLVFLFLQIARQFLNAQTSYRKFVASMGSINIFNNMFKELDANKEDMHENGVLPDFEKELLLDNISLVFPNGKKAINGATIRIKPRLVTAFVGHSGSGKSTIANMVTGMLKPSSGRVFFGDVPYDKLNMKSLRENIGYITQEDIIFSASIKDNISLWEESHDAEKLSRIVEMAHIRGFVDDLPEKQDTMLGDNGLEISGGQRQRITIARELYKDAKILIMDEATSSLDSKAENQIYENLKEYKGRKTMVVIAHRLSTIKNADYLYVLDDGKVVEEGTYEELSEKRGEFTKMVEAQKLT